MSTFYRPGCGCNNIQIDSPQSSVIEQECCTTKQAPCSVCHKVICICKQVHKHHNRCGCSHNHNCQCHSHISDQRHCKDPCSNIDTKLYVKNTVSFSMPQCGSTTTMFIENANRLTTGAVLYAPTVGFLRITNISDNCSITVENTQECCDANSNIAVPGSMIPACTQFSIGIPYCCCEGTTISQDGVFLASCFIIPDPNQTDPCVTIKVTRIGNITNGALINIAGFEYRVSQIIDAETIRICNEGNGGTPNTQVEADANCDGIWDYPIDVIDAPNPCSQEPVSSGLIVVCDGQSETTLQGNIDNQIAVWNQELETWELEVLESNTIDCTILTACLIIDPANPPTQLYVAQVEDTSIFTQTQYQQFQNLLIYINGDPFVIEEVINSTQIRVRPFFEFSEITEYESGVVVCVGECCVQCRPVVETLNRFGLEPPTEVLPVYNEFDFSIPDGISVRNYFDITQPGTTNPLAYNPTEIGLWSIYYRNDGACRRYIELKSNWDIVLNIPTGVIANLEYRIHNSLNTTQAFAAIPIVGNDESFIADNNLLGGDPGNLSLLGGPGEPAYKDINTFKGFLTDRDFLDPLDEVTFYGHVRLTFVNTTGAPVLGSFVTGIRAWYTTWDYELGPIAPV